MDVNETPNATAIKGSSTPVTVSLGADGYRTIPFSLGDKNSDGTYTPKKIYIVVYDGDTPGTVIEMPVPPYVDFGSQKVGGTYTREIDISGMLSGSIETGIAGSGDKSAFNVVRKEDGKLTVTFNPTEGKLTAVRWRRLR